MIQFLKILLASLKEFIRKPVVTDNVDPSERITRYLLSKSEFVKTKGKVKHNAFMPPPTGKKSVYRTSGLTENEIWNIGKQFVAKPRNKTLRARGDIAASDIQERGLQIIPDKTPHPKHADIVGWPSEKHDQLMIAKILESKASLHLP